MNARHKELARQAKPSPNLIWEDADLERFAELVRQEELIQFNDGKWSYVRKPWVGLTDEQLSETYNELYTQYTKDDVNIADFILIARAIEAKLKEKNGG